MSDVKFSDGADFVLLDFPDRGEFGIDRNCWETGVNFRGIKNIPPGPHILFYSCANSDGQCSPRSCFFHFFKPNEILIRKWNPKYEEIDRAGVNQEDRDRVEINMPEISHYLGEYPYDNYKLWVSISRHISQELISKLQPKNVYISSVTEFESEQSNSQQRLASVTAEQKSSVSSSKPPANMQAALKRLPKLNLVSDSQIRFTAVPTKRYPTSATPSEISVYGMDRSYTLELLLKKFHLEFDLLGEMEFAFSCFLYGQVFDAFSHWKDLVRILCSCQSAVMDHTELFDQFLTHLYYTIGEVDEGFFLNLETNDNFIVMSLRELFANIESSDLQAEHSTLKKRANDFRKHLKKKLHYDFSFDVDDFAPVVVQTE